MDTLDEQVAQVGRSTRGGRQYGHGGLRRCRRAVVAAALCGVGLGAAGLGTAGPALAAGPADPSAAVALSVPADLHQGMMPADSPDAVLRDAAGRTPGAPTAAATRAGAATTARDTADASASATSALYGPDVSSYQHPGGAPINWGSVAASGQAFAIVKATENGYTNPYLAQDLAGAHDAGLVVGAYAFARPSASAVAQADAFARAIGTLPSPSLPPVLDLEDAGGLSPAALVAWTHAFLDRLQASTGRVPMIYSGPYFWSSALGGDRGFAQYPLWQAQYTSAASPSPMGGWPTYTLWQFTDAASIPGISGGVDQSRFNGTRQQLGLPAPAGPPAPLAAIDVEHLALGGDAGWQGPALGPETDAPGGRVRHYRNGDIYWSPATGAHEVHGGILAAWLALGGPASVYGLPTSDEQGVPGGRASTMRGGTIYWSAAAGAHGVFGAIGVRYAQLGGPGGALGLPTADETDATGGGRVTAFAGGRVYWRPSTGPVELYGAVLTNYLKQSGPSGQLGLPTAAEADVPGGRGARFDGGVVLWSPATGAHSVWGAVLGRWTALGGSGGGLGLPTADEADAGAGRVSTFTGGHVYWSAPTGAVEVYGGTLTGYLARGGAAGYLGLPTVPEGSVPGGRLTAFQAGEIVWGPATGAQAVMGAIRVWYDAIGGAATLGVPTADETGDGAGRRSDFTRGKIYWSATTGAHEVRAPIVTGFVQAGATGAVGFPLTSAVPVAAGLTQRFQRAQITWDASTGTTTVKPR